VACIAEYSAFTVLPDVTLSTPDSESFTAQLYSLYVVPVMRRRSSQHMFIFVEWHIYRHSTPICYKQSCYWKPFCPSE